MMAKTFDELARRVMTKKERAAAKARAHEIMASMFLSQIRKARGQSQAELARKIGIKQPSLSRIENNAQAMEVSTLKTLIEAMGGELAIVARFPKGVVQIADFTDEGGDQPKNAKLLAKYELV